MDAVPELGEIARTARVVALPMVTRFRGITVREAMLFEGPEGWTEFSPFVEYDDREATAWLAGAIDYGWRAAPEPVRDTVPVNATVPAVDADEVAAVLERFPGCRTAKVKVADPGQTLAQDVARVAAVREALGPEGRVRVDANAGWGVDAAERAVHALAPFDLEYVEQPCASVPELAELRERIAYLDVPVAADESVRKADDPLAVAEAGAADVIVVKAQPLGGIHRVLDLTRRTGLPVVVSSALDTSIGLAMGVRLAAAMPELPYDCGLGTASLFTGDVVDAPLRPVAGALPVGRCRPAPTLLDRYAAPPARFDWWMERLGRVHAVLAASAPA
ncbi:o-succinylbenzoate synthase [Agromyces archimandritae]|uniref:o-succinylbenzoate synthase n=1 Tax=Agromyces archimandritae TaxID=2781962 RepID=A0A975IP58_9MICO|nr:o-succinylbenzoate synthase [Agromyces archimandritae]QTX03621.1 o-succinylbenzoate synthase [Agromyces archimandritae]